MARLASLAVATGVASVYDAVSTSRVVTSVVFSVVCNLGGASSHAEYASPYLGRAVGVA